MQNEFVTKLRLKTDQLEASLESGSPYALAQALTTAFDICQATLLSLPEIVDVHPDFFQRLKDTRPEIKLSITVPASPNSYLCEEKDS